jgi:hypothetical protein
MSEELFSKSKNVTPHIKIEKSPEPLEIKLWGKYGEKDTDVSNNVVHIMYTITALVLKIR